jgi:hypothetical protein
VNLPEETLAELYRLGLLVPWGAYSRHLAPGKPFAGDAMVSSLEPYLPAVRWRGRRYLIGTFQQLDALAASADVGRWSALLPATRHRKLAAAIRRAASLRDRA